MEKISPMMKQYLETKEQYPDAILMFRLGDFYEMFFKDAEIASNELNLVLTGKDCGLEERAPMCGVPYHAIDSYLSKLVQLGHKVAIAEQMEDPKLAKGVVKREVIKVVTPGTYISDVDNNVTTNSYITSIYVDASGFGISLVDFVTGEFLTSKISSIEELPELLNRFNIKEILFNKLAYLSNVPIDYIENELHISVTKLEDSFYVNIPFDKTLDNILSNINYYDKKEDEISKESIISLYKYLADTQKMDLSHLDKVSYFSFADGMVLDNFTIRNLELVETLRDKKKQGSLLWVLDKTKTAMGSRLLRKMITTPLVSKDKINDRLDAVSELIEMKIDTAEIREYLNAVYDLERIITRICLKTANPRDLLSFKNSIENFPYIKNLLKQCKSKELQQIYNSFDTLEDLYDLIEGSLITEASLSIRDGGLFKDGYNEEVDRLRESKIKGKEWLSKYEEEERRNTGIKALKLKYNNIFGYLFELTNANKTDLPEYFVRKQTLSNAERYTTSKLQELQDIVLNSEERLKNVEYELYLSLREKLATNVIRIKESAKLIAKLDSYISLSVVADKNDYVRPEINIDGIINIKDGRHPVIEEMIGRNAFIPNDTYLDRDKYIDIITGPNMAGKSTYMRQVALITLMAQIGSFVPANMANIGIVDRIFTRVGASDDLSSGQSTFMVEMTELANILKFATQNSLIILDEIGRGTSTYDGMAIAWSVVEYISNTIKSKTFFATHYHELTVLEGKLEGVKNYNIQVMDKENEIIFLRKIAPGAADKSYGIQVANLAGVPSKITKRAFEILEDISK